MTQYDMNAKKLAFTLENVEFKFTSDHDSKPPCFVDHQGSLHIVMVNVIQTEANFNKTSILTASEIIQSSAVKKTFFQELTHFKC